MDDRKTIPPIVPEELVDGVRVVAMSDVGCVREENQDFMGWFSVEGTQLLVVADGMGGHSGGFEASRIAVDQVRSTFVELGAGGEPGAVLTEALRQANHAVREVAAANALMKGMGTTAVMALVRGGQAWLAHVGDSRCYLIRNGRATLLTMDHSRVNRMVAAGLLSPEAAEDHPMGHILERSIGADDHVEVEISSKPLQLLRGDRLMLCSDGLWGLVKGPEIAELFTGRPLAESVQAAIDLALERGADDNTTVGSLEVVEGLALQEVVGPPGAEETRKVPAAASTSQIPELHSQPPPPRPGPDAATATGVGFILTVVLLGVLAVILVGVGLRIMTGDPPREEPTAAPTGKLDPDQPKPGKPAPDQPPAPAVDDQDQEQAKVKQGAATGERDETGSETEVGGATVEVGLPEIFVPSTVHVLWKSKTKKEKEAEGLPDRGSSE